MIKQITEMNSWVVRDVSGVCDSLDVLVILIGFIANNLRLVLNFLDLHLSIKFFTYNHLNWHLCISIHKHNWSKRIWKWLSRRNNDSCTSLRVPHTGLKKPCSIMISAYHRLINWAPRCDWFWHFTQIVNATILALTPIKKYVNVCV